MTITVELEPDVLEALRAEAKAQGRDMASLAADAVRQRYAAAKNAPGEGVAKKRTLYDSLKEVLGPDWPGPGGDSRLSEVEAACDPLPDEPK